MSLLNFAKEKLIRGQQQLQYIHRDPINGVRRGWGVRRPYPYIGLGREVVSEKTLGPNKAILQV